MKVRWCGMRFKLLIAGLAALTVSACGKSVDREYLDLGPNNLNQNCDPLDGKPLSTQQYFKGTLALLPTGMTGSASTSIHTFWQHDTQGHMISPIRSGNIDLYTSQLYVPGRTYTSGFNISTSPDPIMDPDNPGQILTEYFSIQFTSNLVLGNKAPGKYYIAAVVDDGVKVEVDSGSGFKYILSSGNQKTETLVCSQIGNFIELDANSKFPIRITYFQGPRQAITFALIMKKVEDSDINLPVDSDCGLGGANRWFDAATSTPKAQWNSLLSRGWEVLTADSLFLGEGLKTCN